jgi:hypothetical protein
MQLWRPAPESASVEAHRGPPAGHQCRERSPDKSDEFPAESMNRAVAVLAAKCLLTVLGRGQSRAHIAPPAGLPGSVCPTSAALSHHRE